MVCLRRGCTAMMKMSTFLNSPVYAKHHLKSCQLGRIRALGTSYVREQRPDVVIIQAVSNDLSPEDYGLDFQMFPLICGRITLWKIGKISFNFTNFAQKCSVKAHMGHLSLIYSSPTFFAIPQSYVFYCVCTIFRRGHATPFIGLLSAEVLNRKAHVEHMN